MAGLAIPEPNKELQPRSEEPPAPVDTHKEANKAVVEADDIQIAAARLYGSGYKRPQIQKILLDHLAPAKRPGRRDRTREEQQSMARRKLRRWEQTQSFRDLIYQHAVVELDLDIPDILHGVARKGKAGRVDAARLALEVTGRHNPKGQDKPTEITLNIANVPRP